MPVHPHFTPLIEALNEGRPVAELDAVFPVPNPPLFPELTVRARAIDVGHGSIPVRTYTPPGDGPFAAIAYIHGGGWVGGDLDMAESDSFCRAMARHADAVVVSIDYRLAPVAPYPAALEDCTAVVEWLADHADVVGAEAGRLAVAGSSAGANIAAGVAIRLRHTGESPINALVLAYPATDPEGAYTDVDGDLPEILAAGWVQMIKAMWGAYLGDAATESPEDAVVGLADLHDLPPVFVLTAEYDTLRAQGEEFVAGVREAGGVAEIADMAGMLHGAIGLIGIYPEVDQPVGRATAWLKERLA